MLTKKESIKAHIVGGMISKEKYMFVDKYLMAQIIQDALEYLTEDISLKGKQQK